MVDGLTISAIGDSVPTWEWAAKNMKLNFWFRAVFPDTVFSEEDNVGVARSVIAGMAINASWWPLDIEQLRVSWRPSYSEKISRM